MNKTEFLDELKTALEGSVPESVIAENLNYYDNYISGEIRSGRGAEEIFEELGDPRLIARTIIASTEAEEEDGPFAGGFGGAGGSRAEGTEEGGSTSEPNFHYIDLNKWYWRAAAIGVVLLILYVLLFLVGGFFILLFRFGGPILLALLLWTLLRRLF